MFTTASLIGWLAALGVGEGLPVNVRVYRGDQTEVDDPERHVYITRVSGPGQALQGLTDTSGWVVEVRGEQNQPDTAETLAMRIDAALLGTGGPAPWPAQVGDTRILAVVRSAGPPVASPFVEDDADRTPYVCTYLITTI